MEVKAVYFENHGEENTDEVLRIAKKRASELGIKTIVVASTRGNVAVKAIEVFSGCKVIAVSHCNGFREPNTQEFTEENRNMFESKGGKIVTTTHAFGGLSMAMRTKFKTHVIGDIIANTLRTFGQGMKVAFEITIMASDAGVVRTDEDIISIGGSGNGADVAIVVKPVNTNNFFDFRVREILCKPRF